MTGAASSDPSGEISAPESSSYPGDGRSVIRRSLARSTIATSRQSEPCGQPTRTSPRTSATASRPSGAVRPVRGSQRTGPRRRCTISPRSTAPRSHVPGTLRRRSLVTAPATVSSRTLSIRSRVQTMPASHTRPAVADGTNEWADPRCVGGPCSDSGSESTSVLPPLMPANTTRPPQACPQAARSRAARRRRHRAPRPRGRGSWSTRSARAHPPPPPRTLPAIARPVEGQETRARGEVLDLRVREGGEWRETGPDRARGSCSAVLDLTCASG